MNSSKNLLVGSGISSYIYFLTKKKKIKVISSNKNNIFKRSNFYEYNSIGGNTNIWGGYINYQRHRKFSKNKNYNKIFKSNFFNLEKIFGEKSKFSNTYCLIDKNKKILRLSKKMFENKLIEKEIKKIVIKKRNVQLIFEDNTKISSNNIILCIGNLNLIQLLFNSDIINGDDLVSFDDGSCDYVMNFSINQKKNYYIPMPFKFIFEKLIFNKSSKYKLCKTSLILQKFSNASTNHEILCGNLLNLKKKKIRYFLSNHVANLRINNIPIRKFIQTKSKRIKVFCSGTVKRYLPGPIIQDLIFDIVNFK